MKTTHEILVEGRARIAKGWTRNAAARNGRNLSVPPNYPDACRWCMTGAIQTGPLWTEAHDNAAWQLANSLAVAVGEANSVLGRLQLYNDFLAADAEEVLRVFDRAIEATK